MLERVSSYEGLGKRHTTPSSSFKQDLESNYKDEPNEGTSGMEDPSDKADQRHDVERWRVKSVAAIVSYLSVTTNTTGRGTQGYQYSTGRGSQGYQCHSTSLVLNYRATTSSIPVAPKNNKADESLLFVFFFNS